MSSPYFFLSKGRTKIAEISFPFFFITNLLSSQSTHTPPQVAMCIASARP